MYYHFFLDGPHEIFPVECTEMAHSLDQAVEFALLYLTRFLGYRPAVTLREA